VPGDGVSAWLGNACSNFEGMQWEVEYSAGMQGPWEPKGPLPGANVESMMDTLSEREGGSLPQGNYRVREVGTERWRIYAVGEERFELVYG
jgi:hypothetical protein